MMQKRDPALRQFFDLAFTLNKYYPSEYVVCIAQASLLQLASHSHYCTLCAPSFSVTPPVFLRCGFFFFS